MNAFYVFHLRRICHEYLLKLNHLHGNPRRLSVKKCNLAGPALKIFESIMMATLR